MGLIPLNLELMEKSANQLHIFLTPAAACVIFLHVQKCYIKKAYHKNLVAQFYKLGTLDREFLFTVTYLL